jgi:hypothetical protein
MGLASPDGVLLRLKRGLLILKAGSTNMKKTLGFNHD